MRRWILLAFCLLLTTSEAGYYRMKPQAGTYKNPRGGVAVGIYGSAPYSLVDGMYGNAAGTGNGNSSCTGEISTDFEWVPDTIPGTTRPNLADEPPAELILREAIDIGARVISVNTEAYVEVNHGLAGFPLLNGSPGPSIPYVHDDLPWFAGGTVIGVIRQTFAKGIRYRIIRGAKNITVTCDPKAISIDTLGSGDTYVRYMASLIVPRVIVKGTKLANQLNKTDWYIPHYSAGQTVKCEVELSAPWESSGIDINWPTPTESKGFKWELGSLTSNYRDAVFTADVGRYNVITSDHLESADLQFFSAKAGNPSLRVNFGLRLPAYAPTGYDLNNLVIDLDQSDPNGSQININRNMICVRPKFQTWDVASQNKVTQVSLPADGRPGVRYGTDNFPGQVWTNALCDFQGSAVAFSGHTTFLQLITASRECTGLVGQQGYGFRNVWFGKEACDTTAPYKFGKTVEITTANSGQDSPIQFLYPNNNFATMNTITSGSGTATDTFRTYLLFRPATLDKDLPTYWISIAKYTWQWAGSVTFNRAAGTITITGDGSFIRPAAEEQMPTWTRNLPYDFPFVPFRP